MGVAVTSLLASGIFTIYYITLHNVFPEKVNTPKNPKKTHPLREGLLLVPSVQNPVHFLCCQKATVRALGPTADLSFPFLLSTTNGWDTLTSKKAAAKWKEALTEPSPWHFRGHLSARSGLMLQYFPIYLMLIKKIPPPGWTWLLLSLQV